MRTRNAPELLDYPGEWLLDLPLLGMTFRGHGVEVSQQMRALS